MMWLPVHVWAVYSMPKGIEASGDGVMTGCTCLQVHRANKHVEYRGDIVELTDALLRLPAGGQVLLSDTTFQRIGGRLHEVKLPSLQLPRTGEALERRKNSIEGQRVVIDGQSRHQSLEGGIRTVGTGTPPRKSVEAQRVSIETQSRNRSLETVARAGDSHSLPSSRRSSTDSAARLVVRLQSSSRDACNA